MTVPTTHIDALLATHLEVDPSYVHRPKQVAFQPPLVQDGSLLKWYEVYALETPVPEAIRSLARGVFESNEMTVEGLGFVVLHHCGNDFYFLITCTWRNENELWQTGWYKDGDAMACFAEFPVYGRHKPTFCVWELVPVLHEQQAWERFLRSERRQKEVLAWASDHYSGAT